MTDRSWKGYERKIAKKLGGEGRTPLSGSNSKITAADVIHDRFFVECKHRKQVPIGKTGFQLLADTCLLAKAENKIPMVVFRKKGERKVGDIIMLRLDDFTELIK